MVVILIKILLDPILLGAQLLSFLHAKMYSKIACIVSSGGYGVCVQVIQPFLNFTYLFSFSLINSS